MNNVIWSVLSILSNMIYTSLCDENVANIIIILPTGWENGMSSQDA